jgi:hypothetical protein
MKMTRVKIRHIVKSPLRLSLAISFGIAPAEAHGPYRVRAASIICMLHKRNRST